MTGRAAACAVPAVVENPRQRISETPKNFTTRTPSSLLIGPNSPVTLVAFVGVLWSISGTPVASRRLERLLPGA